MKEYKADPAALWAAMLAACLPAAGLILVTALFFSRWPRLMWLLISIISLTVMLLSFVIFPLYFRRLGISVTASQITVTTGIFFRRTQSVRLDRVQFVQLLSGPFGGILGLNFVTLFVYGGRLTVPFLHRTDREELTDFLLQRGVYHAP